MSRITGIVAPSGISIELRNLFSERVTPALYRGSVLSPPVVMGAASEALLAYSGANAAMGLYCDDLIVVLDGAIYNFDELQKSKEVNLDSPAALIALLYRSIGFEGAINSLNGDFSIALYDEKEGSLWLARDRLGVRPLYYASLRHEGSAVFAFASRPAALLELPGVRREVRKDYLALFAGSHYRTFDNQPELSPYIDVLQLPQANILRLKDGAVTLRQYWNLVDEKPTHEREEKVLVEEYQSLFFDSVALRLAHCEKPAFTLSGGMDSSSTLATAVRVSGAQQEAYSTVYSDPTFDESEDIQSVLEQCVSEWHPFELNTPELFPVVEEMIALHDEPVATATWLSHYLLAKQVKRDGFRELFGGLGGDELNAGEYEHFLYYFADLKQSRHEEELELEIARWSEYHSHPLYPKNPSVVLEGMNTLVDLDDPGRCLPDKKRFLRYQHTLNADFFQLENFQPNMEGPFESYLKNRCYQDLFRETTPCCLRAEDRHLSSLGIRNALPFLDYRLVEFLFSIPGHLKIRAGVTKYLLRQAMQGILPEETRTRIKKTGWNAPAHRWFSEGRTKEQLLDMVQSKKFRERGIYDHVAIQQVIDDHFEIVSTGAVKENHMMFLWQLVNLELWLRMLENS